jgi:hypothetical protein
MSTSLDAATSEDQYQVPALELSGASIRELIVELAQTEYAIRHEARAGSGAPAQAVMLARHETAIVAELRARKVTVHERAARPGPVPGSFSSDAA